MLYPGRFWNSSLAAAHYTSDTVVGPANARAVQVWVGIRCRVLDPIINKQQ